jgi:hypothetical protein
LLPFLTASAAVSLVHTTKGGTVSHSSCESMEHEEGGTTLVIHFSSSYFMDVWYSNFDSVPNATHQYNSNASTRKHADTIAIQSNRLGLEARLWTTVYHPFRSSAGVVCMSWYAVGASKGALKGASVWKLPRVHHPLTVEENANTMVVCCVLQYFKIEILEWNKILEWNVILEV